MPSLWEFNEIQNMIDELKIRANKIRECAKLIIEDSDLKRRMIDLNISNQQSFEDPIYIEQQIYSGFPSKNDVELMQTFHQLDWKGKLEIIHSFEDEKYKTLAERLIYFNAPEILSTTIREKWERMIQQKLHTSEPNVEWLTIPNAISNAKKMLSSFDKSKRQLIEGHLNYYLNLSKPL